MKSKLVIILPALALVGFLFIKPPAIGSDVKNVVVTPTSTSTQLGEPKLRDFDDEGNGPAHFDENEEIENHEFDEDEENHRKPNHLEEDDDEDEDDELEEDSDD